MKRRNLIGLILIALIFMSSISGCSTKKEKNGRQEIETLKNAKKKILFVNSYHKGFKWSDGITNSLREGLSNKKNIELKIHYMDTKRNTEEEFKKQAALNTKGIIEEWKPDLLITSDDNAFKYLIMPYYREVDLPVVFCGLNWDATVYEAPYSNTAGMVEISLVIPLINHLKIYTKGDRIGMIVDDCLSSRKWIENVKKILEISFSKEYFVKTLEEWENAVIKLQDEVDILLLVGNAAINDWDNEEAKRFILENIQKPTGSTYDWMAPYALITIETIAEEQGEYAAETALKILNGTLPSDILLKENKKGRLILNLEIAEKLDIVFLPSLLKNAKIIE